MSSVVIAGDTSGSVTLQAPATAGSTVLTLPSTSGTLVTNASGTAGSATNLAGGSAGVIPYQTGNGATSFSAAGTSGQVLTSAGAGAPTWSTPSAGAMTLISTKTASSSSSLEWTGLTGYNNYMLVVNSLVNTGTYIYFQFGTGAGPTYITSGYYLTSIEYYGGVAGNTQANQSQINLTFDSATVTLSGIYNLFNFTNSKTVGLTSSGMIDTTYNQRNIIKNGQVANSSVITAIKLFPDSGSFTSGTASLYGISS
jgi:hypothetical protein